MVSEKLKVIQEGEDVGIHSASRNCVGGCCIRYWGKKKRVSGGKHSVVRSGVSLAFEKEHESKVFEACNENKTEYHILVSRHCFIYTCTQHI